MSKSLFSTSKSSSGVSYKQIYKSWLKNDQLVNVHSTIPVEPILTKLTIRQVLDETDYEMVDHEELIEKKLLKLFFDILPSKDEQGFDQLVKILLENRCDGLANDLLKEKDNFSSQQSSSGVSYLQIYESWINHDQQVNGRSTIPVDDILIKLRFCQVLTQSNYEMVNHEVTCERKLLKLFNILPSKHKNGFDQLVKILFENKCDVLANDLLKEKDNFSSRDCSNVPTGSVIPKKKICLRKQTSSSQNTQMKGAQAHLSRFIKKNVDFMAKYWSDVIRVAKIEAAFVKVQVMEHIKSEDGNPVASYRDVFNKDGKTIHERISIQADPGCGKTTYVNKLALDWANEDEYLREKFDFVFLIPLQTLTMDVFDVIKWFLPDESEQFFESYAKSPDSKILLILDGFDELVESSEWYSSVMDILNVQSKQFQFFHIIVTTRRSHVDKTPQQFRERSLLIKGFDQQSMKQFLFKQNVPLPTFGEESNLIHLLKTPLFCAIYCSLHVGGGDPIELEDSYDLIKALVENTVTNTVKKKTLANEKEQLDEIGKFAFQMLDSASLNFLKMFCRSSKVIKPSFDLSTVNLDLLIKRTIPTRGVGGFKEEFSLPHQLIAEYLAAKHFVRSLTEEQLEHADASALIAITLVANSVFDLPFVRFFLFELLFLYLEKKYEESVFDNLLNIPQLCFFWYCKSNNGIPTLDNVKELHFSLLNNDMMNHSRFVPTWSKCLNLSSLTMSRCNLSKKQIEQFVNFINNNYFQKLIQLELMGDENVGSTHELFTALSKCKYLETLYIQWCNLSTESTNELARCINNNELANLRKLDLCVSENVGSSTNLFDVLHKCSQLQILGLDCCSITQESLNIFLSTFKSNTFQQLDDIWLWGNKAIKVSDKFFIALEHCPNISSVLLSKSVESDLNEVGRKAKETLEDRGCQFLFK